MAALSEQVSVRMTAEQRKYIQEQAAGLLTGRPPVRVREADVIRAIIEHARQRGYVVQMSAVLGEDVE